MSEEQNKTSIIQMMNDLKINQTYIDWEECIPEEVWYKHFEGNISTLAYGLDVDTRRWYETSVSVFKHGDIIIGVRHITNTFSESTYIEDLYHTLEFFEMEEVKTITYKQKK